MVNGSRLKCLASLLAGTIRTCEKSGVCIAKSYGRNIGLRIGRLLRKYGRLAALTCANGASDGKADVTFQNIVPVSYTHLTLPTKRIV